MLEIVGICGHFSVTLPTFLSQFMDPFPRLSSVTYRAFRYPFDIPYNASVPHWAYLDYTVSALDELTLPEPDGLGIGHWSI
jgi:hypothetical protein